MSFAEGCPTIFAERCAHQTPPVKAHPCAGQPLFAHALHRCWLTLRKANIPHELRPTGYLDKTGYRCCRSRLPSYEDGW